MDKLVKIVELLGKLLDAANLVHAALSGITEKFKPVTAPVAVPAPAAPAPAAE